MTDFSVTPGDQISPPSYSPSYSANRPRAVVSLNGVRYPIASYTLDKNAHGATDTGTVSLPISSQDGGKTPGQDFSALLSENTDLTPVYVEIFAGYPSDPVPYSTDISQLQSRFIGVVDAYSATFDGNEVTFTIRSLAAPLIDIPITTMKPSTTSLAFAQQQANALGLTLVASKIANPVTIQETLAREFIGGANINVAVFKLKPWDLLLQMAQFDDVDVWVDGSTLYYMAPYDVQRSVVDLEYGRDFAPQLVGTHSVEFNRKVRVEVRSYQPKTKISHVTRTQTNPNGGVTTTQSVKTVVSNPIFGTNQSLSTSYNPTTGTTTSSLSSATGGSVSSATNADSESGLLIYKEYRPNLSPSRAAALAASLWRQYSMHQYGLKFSLPATPQRLAAMAITSIFNVSRLQYQKFNSKYWPRKINEQFDLAGGFRFDIEALNTVLPQGAV